MRRRLPVTCISSRRSGKRLGNSPVTKLAAALQHRHTLAGPCQPRGGNAAAIARPHDDDVVAVADVLEGARKAGHTLFLAKFVIVDRQLTDLSRPNYNSAAQIDSKITMTVGPPPS